MENKKKPIKRKNKSIFDIVIPHGAHSEYIAYHDTIDITRIEWAKENRDKLLRKKTPLEEKKEILFALGHGGDLKSLYEMERWTHKMTRLWSDRFDRLDTFLSQEYSKGKKSSKTNLSKLK